MQSKKEIIDMIIDYALGCNIDLNVVLEDLKLPLDSIRYEDLPANFKRCEKCGVWFFAAHPTHTTCIEC